MRYIQDPKTGKLVPAHEYHAENRRISWQVMPDIQPYISQIDGHVVQSRRDHRAHLRINNCVEVGNEKQTWRPPAPPPGLKETIIEIARDKLRYT